MIGQTILVDRIGKVVECYIITVRFFNDFIVDATCMWHQKNIWVESIYKFLMSTLGFEPKSPASKAGRIPDYPTSTKVFIKPAHGTWTPDPISTSSHHLKAASFFSIWTYSALDHSGIPQPFPDITWHRQPQRCFNHQPVINGLGRLIVSFRVQIRHAVWYQETALVSWRGLQHRFNHG